jgi:hypothetical protein
VTYVKKTLSDKATENEILDHEVLPVLRETRRQLNRLTNIKTVTSDYTVNPDDYTILIDASSNDVDITLLPAATVPGWVFNFKCIDATNTPRVVAASGETIDGAAAWTSALNKGFIIQSDKVDAYYILAWRL